MKNIKKKKKNIVNHKIKVYKQSFKSLEYLKSKNFTKKKIEKKEKELQSAKRELQSTKRERIYTYMNSTEKEELCDFSEPPTYEYKTIKDLWSFHDLVDIDKQQDDVCNENNPFFDEKYIDNDGNIVRSDYKANIKAILFYFERFKELLAFIKEFIDDTQNKIDFSE